jgi:hypothetical protein
MPYAYSITFPRPELPYNKAGREEFIMWSKLIQDMQAWISQQSWDHWGYDYKTSTFYFDYEEHYNWFVMRWL